MIALIHQNVRVLGFRLPSWPCFSWELVGSAHFLSLIWGKWKVCTFPNSVLFGEQFFVSIQQRVPFFLEDVPRGGSCPRQRRGLK